MTITDNNPKIFGVGLNKTGTTTLGQSAKLLGYRCTSCSRELLEDVTIKNDFSRIKDTVNQFDLFEDWPWPLIYKELDAMFPGSKFILTVRKDANVWLNSLKQHSMKTPPRGHFRKLAYGYNYPHRHEREHLDFYKIHNDDVRSYFKARDSDFMEICWENGHGFEELCNFLQRDIPDSLLPHANKGTDNQVSRRTFLANKFLSIFS